MPQTFQVLRCYKCSVFQVHQVRKDNKWVCKMCNEKQSVKRHYGLGTGKDCRIHVQKLNKLRGEKEGTEQIINSEDSEQDDCIESYSNNKFNSLNPSFIESKWTAFIDKPEVKVEDNETEYFNDRDVVLEIPQKRKINNKLKQTKYLKKSVRNTPHCEIEVRNDNIISDRNNIENKIDVYQKQDLAIPDVSSDYEGESQKNVERNIKQHRSESEEINKASRWAQFVDLEQSQHDGGENNENKNCRNPLFSLCDDNDIDTILDF